MRILLLILLPPLFLITIALATVWVLAAGVGSTSCALGVGTVLALVGVSLVAILYVFGLMMYIMLGYLRLGRDVGAPLLAMGWRVGDAGLLSRRYRGLMGARPAEVVCSPPQGPWPGTIEARVVASVARWLTLGGGALQGATGFPQMVVPMGMGATVLLAADDLVAAQRLLDDPRAMAAIRSLLGTGEPRQLTIAPDGVILSVRYRRRVGGLVSRLVSDGSELLVVAEAAEWAFPSE